MNWEMNWEAFSAVTQLIGVVAVIASVIYLSLQIRETNLQGAATTEREWYVAWNDAISSLTRDKDSISAFRRGLADFDSLEKDDQAIFDLLLAKIINLIDLAKRQSDKGLMPPDTLHKSSAIVAALISTPGGRRYWEIAGQMYFSKNYIDLCATSPSKIPPLNEALPWWANGETEHNGQET